jgi:NAD(P)-dependent dehydrogenase (short-subunit alcohol dehydrogenase family)
VLLRPNARAEAPNEVLDEVLDDHAAASRSAERPVGAGPSALGSWRAIHDDVGTESGWSASMSEGPLITSGSLQPDRLAGNVVIVTGAGTGIGLEAARALLDLEATVVVAEIDEAAGRRAALTLGSGRPEGRLLVIPTDVTDDASVERMVSRVLARFGRIDAVINNATVATAGQTVWETPIADWDASYLVNVRGPVLLARATLPGMIARRRGTFVCVSSTGGPFLAAYESAKSAQVTIANALDQELADSGVVAFTIGPGLVPTATATAAVERLAPRLGLGVEEFWKVNEGVVLSVEAAGAGFAAAVALADRYAGQEVSSTQALVDAGIEVGGPDAAGAPTAVAASGEAVALSRRVRATLAEQAAGWRERSFFERQWMSRDFKQRAGMPVERWLEALDRLPPALAEGHGGEILTRQSLERLASFYGHLGDLARGYVRDPAARDDQIRMVARWQEDAARLASLMEPTA